MCMRACWRERERERERERKREREREREILLQPLDCLAFSFAISNLLVCGAIWWLNLLYERRPGNAVGRVFRLVGSVLDQSTAHSFIRCQYYFESKRSEYG